MAVDRGLSLEPARLPTDRLELAPVRGVPIPRGARDARVMRMLRVWH